MKWSDIEANTVSGKKLRLACMSRNRDLNGDGEITEDEVRWYAPTLRQYAGFWIGESAISSEARLYNKSTSMLGTDPNENTGRGNRMIYWTSTKGIRDYFAEEGMATNDASSGEWAAKYVRCVRNIASKDEGYDKNPEVYYTVSNTYLGYPHDVDLKYVDADAVNITGSKGELISHDEREDGNKAARRFRVAAGSLSGATMKNVVDGTFKCDGKYSEDGKIWRVPNQREFMMMYFLNYEYVNKCFCRTIFSNDEFRYSWTYDDGVFTMWKPNQRDNIGSVRCISVLD